MSEKLFLLGRPGSGKSTVRRYITKMAQHKFWSAYPMSDNKILQNMCAADHEHIHFRPAATQETVRQLQETLGLSGHRIQLMRTDGPRDECLYDSIRPFAQTLMVPDSQSRRITGPLVPSHIS